MGRKLGLFRASYLASASCMALLLLPLTLASSVCGVLTLESFQRDFQYSESQKTAVNSNAVSILQAGAFLGCFLTAPRSNNLTVGTILQIINAHTLTTFYAGRVIAGVGIGAATVLIPMYSAEMAPKEMRGRLGACFQLFFALGVMIAYWVTFAASETQPSEPKQWQIALDLWLLPSTWLLIGMVAGRREEVWESLKWVRGGEDTTELQQEFDEIIAALKKKYGSRKTSLGLCAQLSNNTSLAYYATQIFSAVGAGSSRLVTGFFGSVKVIGVSIFQLFIIDKIGRRVPFMAGAFAMGSFILIIACVLATHPTSSDGADSGATPAGIAMIIMVYAEARLRDVGVTVGAASQWLFNFIMSQVTPHAIDNIGWRMFLMFAIFNYVIVVYSWIFLRETLKVSLEEMQGVFGAGTEQDGKPTLEAQENLTK
ncbi:general substrate transporter [Aspergillus navahoensis]